MKKIIYSLLLGAAAAGLTASCSDDCLDDMTGRYADKAPKALNLTSLAEQTSVKDGSLRRHSLTLKGGDGAEASFTFVCSASTIDLTAGTYTWAQSGAAAAGNFDNAAIGGEAVGAGSVTVKTESGVYAFSGLVQTASGNWYRLNVDNIAITFEPDPEPDKYYTSELMQQPCMLADNTVVPGVYKAGFAVLDEGGQTVAYFEPVKAEGAASLVGSYTLAEYASAEGQMANGYSMDLSMWGMGVISGGSYVVSGGQQYFLNAGGTVTVVANADGTFTISGTGLTASDPEGAPAEFSEFSIDNIQSLPALPAGGNDDPAAEAVVLTQVLSTQSQNGTVTVKLGTDGFTVRQPDYVTSFEETYEGQGNILSFDIVTSDGTLVPGVYTAAAQESAAAGNFIAGYDTTVDWGWGPMAMTNWGTCWFTVDNGLSGAHITSGTLTVDTNADGYAIDFDGALEDGTPVKASFKGAITF